MENPVDTAVQAVEEITQTRAISDFLESPLGNTLITVIIIAVLILLTLIIHRCVTVVLRKIERQMVDMNNQSAALVGFARHIISIMIYFAGAVAVLSCIPPIQSALKTVLGAGGILAVVAGFASQEALGSIVSGVMIIVFKPFILGDVIRYLDGDISGVVEEITLHHTTIRTLENKRVIVPNSKMNSAIVENADYGESKVCALFDIGITYESDIEQAKAIMAKEIQNHRDFFDYRTLEQKESGAPEVVVRVVELADSAVVLRAWLWARDNGTAAVMKCDLLQSVKRAYDAAGIDIAYPHLVVVNK